MMGSSVNSTSVSMGMDSSVIWKRSWVRLCRSSRKPAIFRPSRRFSWACQESRMFAYQMYRNTAITASDSTLYRRISMELSPGNLW